MALIFFKLNDINIIHDKNNNLPNNMGNSKSKPV